MRANRFDMSKVIRWAIRWQSDKDEHFMWADYKPLLFATKRDAMEYIRPKYGYIRTRKDLRAAPFNWRMPKPVRVAVTLTEAKRVKR